MRLASVLATTFRRSLLFVVLLGSLTGLSGQAPARPPAAAPPAKPAEPVVTGVRLAELTWPVAEQRLTPETVVVLPLGAAALQHGLHLRLENDRTLADYFTSRILQLADVVAAPPLPYHYFPAFAEYPGSTSLSLTTARDLTADVVRSLARSGPRRFYVLNTGDSSAQALAAAAKLLASDGILLHYTDWRAHMDGHARHAAAAGRQPCRRDRNFNDALHRPVGREHAQRAAGLQPGGEHAISVDATGGRTRNVFADRRLGRSLARDPGQRARRRRRAGERDPHGHRELCEKRRCRSPVPGCGQLAAPASVRPPQSTPRPTNGECQPGDDRTIRAIGPAFQLAWANQDVDRIVSFWSAGGDMAHPDGLVESNAKIIGENRAYLFRQPEYRSSRHYLAFGTIRCITPDVAIADAKWELRGMTDAKGQPAPSAEGLCTLVLMRQRGLWLIEAWRYNVKPETPPNAPIFLKKPGFLPR